MSSVFSCNFLSKAVLLGWRGKTPKNTTLPLHSILLLSWDWLCSQWVQQQWHPSVPCWWAPPGRKHALGSYKAESCTEVVGGSASDLMVTAVSLQTGFGQVEIYWPVKWDLLRALQVLPVWPWANHFSAFSPSFICLVYLVSQEAPKSRDCILLSVCTVPSITGPQASWGPKDAVAMQVVNVEEV